MAVKVFIFVLAVAFLKEAAGHGMMLEPANRASLWRFYAAALTDYDDNAFNCGGFWVRLKL